MTDLLVRHAGAAPEEPLPDLDLRRGPGATFDVLGPATHSVITTVSAGTAGDAREEADAAAAALPAWSATAPRERTDMLLRANELMAAQAGEPPAPLAWENSKTLAYARGEAACAAHFRRWSAEEAVRTAGSGPDAPTRPRPPGRGPCSTRTVLMIDRDTAAE